METVAIDSSVEKPASTSLAAVDGPIPGKSVINLCIFFGADFFFYFSILFLWCHIASLPIRFFTYA
ncbi:MAG: hypothetical protein ACXACY_13780 [Candidatus Hodarchaeales archaeon]